MSSNIGISRVRWAAVGAAVAVTLGAIGINSTTTSVDATTSSGERAIYTAITPCRLTDTRPNTTVGPTSTPLGPASTTTIEARGANGNCTATDLPTDATALALNVTALRATELTFLTIWADGPLPTASSLNPAPGQPPVPNAVTTTLSATGSFNVYNDVGTTDLVIDVIGFYTDHDHTDLHFTKSESDDRYATRTRQVVVSPAGFGPSTIWGNAIDVPTFSVSNIFGSYFTGGDSLNGINLNAVAPLDLPVGSRITSITYHYTDNSPLLLGAIRFSVSRTSLSENSQGSVTGTFFETSGADPSPRSATVTLDHVVGTDQELHLSAFVRTVWPGEASKLAIKGVVIEYELP